MHRIDPKYTHTLTDGYLLRWATSADADAYAALAEKSFVISHLGINNPNVGLYARDMCSGQHPLCQPNDIAVVCAPDGRMVAAAALQRQPLHYAGISLSVGRPELVCSDPDVRQRGFVRAIMHLLHHKSTLRGDVMQAITGIPNYYHQFGYVWSVDYNAYAHVAFGDIPPEVTTQLHIRRAQLDEYALFCQLYDHERAQRNVLLSTPWSEAYFVHALAHTRSREQHVPHFICDHTGTIIGFITLLAYGDEDGGLCITGMGFAPTVAPSQYFIPTLQALQKFAGNINSPHPAYPTLRTLFLQVDAQPHWQTLLTAHQIPHRYEAPYTWYLRVADFGHLLWQIRTALETRLAESVFRGYTGSLILWFYGDGLALEWQNGRLTNVSKWQNPAYGEGYHASYPPGILAQQVFGWRSFRELHTWRKDVWARAESIPMLEVLFPVQHSWFLWFN